jgi:hypothetical protein
MNELTFRIIVALLCVTVGAYCFICSHKKGDIGYKYMLIVWGITAFLAAFASLVAEVHCP